MMVMLEMISGPFQAIFLPSSRGTQSQTVRAENRIISYSMEIYRRHQDNRYILRCDAGENVDDIGTLMEIENALQNST